MGLHFDVFVMMSLLYDVMLHYEITVYYDVIVMTSLDYDIIAL